MSKKTFYITTPIYYPSGQLHIGHVYTTTIAWTLRNYKRKLGYDTLFLTGADEHGQKIQKIANKYNILPQKYVDGMSEQFINLWKLYNIDYDIFSRTTNKNHMKQVQNIFEKLYLEKYIYLSKYSGLYSIEDEEFILEKEAVKIKDKYYHPISHHLLKNIEEDSYFLKLSLVQKWLIKYIDSHDQFIEPIKIIRELKRNFFDTGINDLSITRTSFSWGISIKKDSKHVIYVWLDALTNYITMLGYGTNNNELYNKFWANDGEKVHIIGKEITRFHCIYWPSILHLLGINQPTRIQSHGWIITPTGKMSKSKNNALDPIKLLENFNQETIKYFLIKKIKLDNDGVFSNKMLTETYNADLANTFGNLVSRTIAMFKQNFPSFQLKFKQPSLKIDIEFNEKMFDTFKLYKKNMDSFKLDLSFEYVINFAKYSNNYIDMTEPWKLKNNLPRLMSVLYNLFNSIYAISSMMDVVIPNKISIIATMLNINCFDFDQINNYKKFHNKILNIKETKIIFPRK